MKRTQFSNKFTKHTGINELMEDLGKAMQDMDSIHMLGGGNPAHIPEINAIWRRRTEEILANGDEFEKLLVNYDTPQGKISFLESIANFMNREFQWKISAKNIAITNGSQSAFFMLLNFFAGKDVQGNTRQVLFPLSPEYIGYADQTITPNTLISHPAKIKETQDDFFKYHIDFPTLDVNENISALCVSRPTNPTGNVLTDAEIDHLSRIAKEKGIHLIIDNAYGAPFPNILFKDVKPYWDEHVILGMSLSKLGLPSLRTGIIIASEEIISAISACNAVLSLSNGSFGQGLLQPLFDSGEILSISRNIIRPFYEKRSQEAVKAVKDAFGNDFPYRIHEPEGAMFLWLWFPNLPIPSKELYEKLKKRNVLVVSGHYFFYALDKPWKHSEECLRLSFAQNPDQFRKALAIIADEVRNISS